MPRALLSQRFAALPNPTILLLFCLLLSCGAALPVSGAGSETNANAPVLSMREFELKPGVSAAEFEQFVRGEMASTVARNVKGMKIEILKGDRGERKGAYILVWEFDSVATRNQFFPREGGGSGPPFKEAWDHIKTVMGKFRSYVKELSAYTDYVVVSH
jgi:hypothetical protein